VSAFAAISGSECDRRQGTETGESKAGLKCDKWLLWAAVIDDDELVKGAVLGTFGRLAEWQLLLGEGYVPPQRSDTATGYEDWTWFAASRAPAAD
jgi:hypothetical protein